MAITRGDYEIFKWIRGRFPSRPEILEIGEAELYGDIPFGELRQDIRRYGTGLDLLELSRQEASVREGKPDGHALAKLVYRVLFDPILVRSIDLHGTSAAIQMDLNKPVTLGLFDLVYNTGTAEHVFDIARVLRTCHDGCKAGGYMVHCFPFTGMVDHGFWSVNPTLIYDLARANGYVIERVAMSVLFGAFEWLSGSRDVREWPNNAWLHVGYRKVRDVPFVVPMQGYYREPHTEESRERWLMAR